MGLSATGGGGTTTPPATTSTGGNHYDAQGNWVDANGNVILTAAQMAQQNTDRINQSIATSNQQEANTNPKYVQTLVTGLDKDNPVAGTIHAGEDIANGDYSKAGGDFTQGYTYGTIPIGGNTIPTTETALGKLPDAVSDAAPKLASAIGNALSGAPDPSTDALSGISNQAISSQQELDTIRRNAEANPTQAPQAGLVQLDQTNIDPLRQRQGVALDALTAAANGTAPSAADIAGKEAANRAAAQAYGTAAALQGGNSSGGTLRAALDAQTQIQGDANTQAMINRANEQATARGQLVQGLQAATNEEGNLSNADATLSQQKNLANQTSDINTRSQDISREQNLISGANASQNTATTAAKAALDAKVQEQANNNAMKGAEIGAGAGAISKIISDRRSKKNIRKADLVQLAEEIPGYTFDYKDPKDGPGRRVSVMAQDVQGSRLGKDMVQLDGDGALVLDGANSVGAALAMAAEALREAEKAKAKAKKGRK